MQKTRPRKINSYPVSKRVPMMIVAITILVSGTFATILFSDTYAQTASPTSSTICPAKNVQHWDKIIFSIKSPALAQRLKIPANTELDIKVLDNPTTIADLKQKVFNFLKVTNESRSAVEIIDVRYAIICVSG